MDVALLLLRDRGEKRRFPISHDVLTIGRGEGCDLRIPLGEVSRRHCSLIKSDDGLQIQDIGSSNGTFVNGKRIQETILRPGDQIRIGSLRFIVQINGEPTEDNLEAFTTAAGQTAPETPAVKGGDATADSHASARKTAKVPQDVDNLIDILDEDDDANFP